MVIRVYSSTVAPKMTTVVGRDISSSVLKMGSGGEAISNLARGLDTMSFGGVSVSGGGGVGERGSGDVNFNLSSDGDFRDVMQGSF